MSDATTVDLAGDSAAQQGLLWCDEPVDGHRVVGEAVEVSGWAHAPVGVSAVIVSVNLKYEHAAELGRARPDVAAALDDPTALHSGWRTVLDDTVLHAGDNHVQIVAELVDGRTMAQERRVTWRPLAAGEIPYDQVDRDGERFDPSQPLANSVAVEHRARYELAAAYAAGRRVLDAGCGLGDGARTLAGAGAASVDAIDASSRAIARAGELAGDAITWRIGDVRELPYPDDAFDLVTCFDVVEHTIEHDELLAELRRVLAPDGLLLISTPSPSSSPDANPWHLRELTGAELEQWLRASFANVRVLSQRLYLGTLLGDVPEPGDPAAVTQLAAGAAESRTGTVALASDAPLAPAGPIVVLGDARDDLVDATIAQWSARARQAEAESALLRSQLQTARYIALAQDAPDLPPRVHRREDATEQLREQLARPEGWMYKWDLGPDLPRPPIGRELMSVHHTRLELFEGPVRDALAAAGPDATVLDLACSEGWFAHRVLEMGAGTVLGIDLREGNIRRAELVRDHLGIDPGRLSFQQADIFSLPDLPTFDIVMMLGLVYHVENPVGAVRIARALTRSLCVIESQLTEQRAPIMAGNGQSDWLFERPESFAAWAEEDHATDHAASVGGVLSLIPNEAALVMMGRLAGFDSVAIAPPQSHHNPQYRLRQRVVMIGRV